MLTRADWTSPLAWSKSFFRGSNQAFSLVDVERTAFRLRTIFQGTFHTVAIEADSNNWSLQSRTMLLKSSTSTLARASILTSSAMAWNSAESGRLSISVRTYSLFPVTSSNAWR